MSRLSGTEQQIAIRPANTVYTALIGICVVLLIIGLIVLWVRHDTLFGKSLIAPS
jgi:hypothetical protein